MRDWYTKHLGDGIMAAEPLRRITGLFEVTHAAAGLPAEMAVFVRHEPGPLHCEVRVYFSPACGAVASIIGAGLCARPKRENLTLLAGESEAWAALFPEAEP